MGLIIFLSYLPELFKTFVGRQRIFLHSIYNELLGQDWCLTEIDVSSLTWSLKIPLFSALISLIPPHMQHVKSMVQQLVHFVCLFVCLSVCLSTHVYDRVTTYFQVNVIFWTRTCSLSELWLRIWQIVWSLVPIANAHAGMKYIFWVCLNVHQSNKIENNSKQETTAFSDVMDDTNKRLGAASTPVNFWKKMFFQQPWKSLFHCFISNELWTWTPEHKSSSWDFEKLQFRRTWAWCWLSG